MSSSLKSTIEALKLAGVKRKQIKTIEHALEQLDSAPKLLELSNLSADTFARLCSLLRERLLPLYHKFPALTLQYSVSILTIIQEKKISAAVAANDEETRGSWETVQTALLSGILDFIEEHATSGNRANVATALYPAIHTVLFQTSRLPHFGGGLSYTFYQLLSETVTKHPVNQHKLRDPKFLGGKQIGLILSHTKDFLAIEALLELFAKILPSTSSKDGLEKRDAFIQEVFDPTNFAGSKEVVHTLKTISVTDWEATFLKILDILARFDISYPQPFETSQFRTHGLPPCTVERIYIDHSGFLANLDQCGELETLQISFSIIDAVKLAAPSTFKTSITIRLSSPPFVGRTILTPLSEGDIFLSFDIDNRGVARFLESLTKRGLKDVIHRTERKLSKAKAHLEFDFEPDSRRTPISTQDKVHNLARLWDFNSSSSRSGEVMHTSPLLKAPTPHISCLPQKVTCDTTDESDLDDEGELLRQPSSTLAEYGRKAAHTLLNSDDRPGTITRPRPTNRNRIVLSEDEVLSKRSKVVSRQFETSSMEIDILDRAKSVVVSGNQLVPVSEGNGLESPLEKTDAACDNDVLAESQYIQQALLSISPTTSMLATKCPRMAKTVTSDVNIDGSPMTGQKRAAAQDPIPDLTASESNSYPSKRLCGENCFMTDTMASVTRQLPKSMQYGGKGRTSSLPRLATDEVDFDEPPAALSEFNTEKPKSRIVAMKGKRGKNEKPVSGRPKAKRNRPITQQPHAVDKDCALIGPKTPSSPDQNLTTTIKMIKGEEQAIQNIKSTRRSARVANIQADLASKDLRTSTARGKNSASYELIPDISLIKDEVPQKKSTQEETKLFVNSSGTATSAIIGEHSMPTTTNQENDVVMIDLTQDTPKTLSKEASFAKNKPPVTTIITKCSLPDPERLEKLPRLIFPSPVPHLPRNSFTPLLHHRQDRVPQGPSSGLGSGHAPPRRITGTISHADRENAHIRSPIFRNTYDNHFVKETRSREDPILRIVDVISELTEVIVQKASRRFDSVRNDLHVGNNSILFGTADDLEKMHAASIDCFNALVDLEEEYADYRRNVVDGFGDLGKTTQEICRYLAETIQESNRNGLSRKFSNAFFTLPLPAIISNPKLLY